MSESPDKLCRKIDYTFTTPDLLTSALTHRSAGSDNNERLEFLGDAVLNTVMTDELFHRFPEASEGQLSRLRAHLVKGVTLAKLAQELSLGDYLILGPGELKSGGYRRESILAGAFEAVLGAIYLDSDMTTVSALIRRIYRPRMANMTLETVTKDPKTRLQEFLQARKLPLPNYAVAHVEGQEHNQSFTIHCSVPGQDQVIIGHGSSRRRAEQDAASEALRILQSSS